MKSRRSASAYPVLPSPLTFRGDGQDDARVLHLLEIGIVGSGHTMRLERKNVQAANLVSPYLHQKGLAG